MLIYTLSNGLSIKKIEMDNKKDLWLVQQLEKDPLVCGENGYLFPISPLLDNPSYLLSEELYGSPFSIYYYNSPVGFLYVSPLNETKFRTNVSLYYALLEEERKQGYMSQTILEVSNHLLLDPVNSPDRVVLTIDANNHASCLVADRCGFIGTPLLKEDYYDQNIIVYHKTKEMIYK